jgi:uncharacterized iron-regulated protein
MHLLLLPILFYLMFGSPAASGADDLATCVKPGQWIWLAAATQQSIRTDSAMTELARQRVVLLGESHDSAEHHRWQLHTISALYALHPDLVLGFEMFPRRVQPILDEWSAGKLTQDQLLTRTAWTKIWGHDAQLYLPIFHFARMHRIPMLALNVDRSMVGRVSKEGWAALPPPEREGLTDPAPPDPAYLTFLYDSYLQHHPRSPRQGATEDTPPIAPTAADLRNPDFVRFVESMQVWDRAMAQAIAQRAVATPATLVVAIMGSGHLRNGYGVAHQLRSLGITDIAAVLPWDVADDCSDLTPGLADGVFGIDSTLSASAQRPRLGIVMDDSVDGVRIREVIEHSIAETAGLKAGDLITSVAGAPAKEAGDVIGAVQRQAPGTWLPISVKRANQSLELVARFPPAQ